MNLKRLLRLYPKAWRDRYEEEFGALLEQQPSSPLVILDVLLGALDAHLHPNLVAGRMLLMVNAGRSKILVVFCAYISFVVAGLLFYGLVDDSPFIPAMREHLDLTAAWVVIEVGSVIALLAVLVGGLPIALAVLRRVLLSARRDLLFLALPVLAFGLHTAYLALLAATTEGWIQFPWTTPVDGQPRPLGIPPFVGNMTLNVIEALAAAIAISFVVARTDGNEQTFQLRGLTVNIQPYRFAILPGVIAALAMGLMLVGTICWGLIASGEASQAFQSNFVVWLAVVLLMAASTIIAAAAVVKGFSTGATARGGTRGD